MFALFEELTIFYRVGQKVSLQLLSISSPNIDWFSKFYHRHILWKTCNIRRKYGQKLEAYFLAQTSAKLSVFHCCVKLRHSWCEL